MTIEKTFLDRVPKYPGRVILTPVAGQANAYDMVRADEPITEGTALDKATFDSIIKSRLTGRYYLPTVTQETIVAQTITTNPIPTSGWLNATKTTANLNGYEIYGTAASAQSEFITAAFDGNANTYWRGLNNAENYIGFKLPSAIKLSKLRAKIDFTSGDTNTAKVQASNDWTSWTDVSGWVTVGKKNVTEITLTTNKPFYYYRLVFDIYLDTGIDVYSMEMAEYNVTTFRNTFTLENLPKEWTVYQRIMIVTPGNFSTVGVTVNVLNGISCDAILQPNRYYELIFNGSYFWVWEVA